MRPKEEYDIRKIVLKFRVSKEEAEIIEQELQNSGYKSKSDFIRVMIFQGQIIKVSDEFLSDFRRKYSSISNNINQIALRLNSSRNIYAEQKQKKQLYSQTADETETLSKSLQKIEQYLGNKQKRVEEEQRRKRKKNGDLE